MNSPNNDVGDEAVTTMVPCNDCGHLVPEANLAIHQATACGARARHPSYQEEPSSPEQSNLGTRQRRSWSTPDRREGPNVEWSTPTVATAQQPGDAGAVTTAANAAHNHASETAPTATTTGSLKDDRAAASSPDVIRAGDVVDLTSDTPPSTTANTNGEWPCPRCTLLNPKTEGICSACQYHNPDIVRPADPIRRERLVQDTGNFGPSMPAPTGLPSSATSGAILGSFLGAANAYMGGRSVGSGALEGAMTGFVGGAIMGEMMRDMTPTTPPTQQHEQSSVASARSGASMGLPPYPSINSSNHGGNRRMQPRPSIRVVRHGGNGMNGYSSTTIYTSGTETTVAGGDPMLNLMMQSLLNGNRGGGGAAVDGMSYEQLLQAFGDGTENLGAEERDIQSLPTATVRNPETELPKDQRQCCICLEDFQAQETRKTLPCLHGFHEDCVDKWLRSNGSCPICKHKLS